MNKILILGGTGFVSKSLAIHLINRGYQVDILTRGIKTVDYTGFGEHLICDRKDEAALKKTLSGKFYDVVFDISGYTKEDVKIFLDSVERETLSRYVFCSSGAVYLPSNEEFLETSPTGETSTWGKYGFDKLEAENYILEMTKNNLLNAIIFRPSYIYGEGNDLPRESYFFDKIENGQVIKVPAGETEVQFIHINDLVKIFECSIFNTNANRAYNVSSPKHIKFMDLISACEKAANKKAHIEVVTDSSIPAREYFPFRNYNFVMNITDLRENGFHLPVIYLEEGLELTYKTRH